MSDNTTSVCCTFCGMILHDGEQCGCALSTKSIEIMLLRTQLEQLTSERDNLLRVNSALESELNGARMELDALSTKWINASDECSDLERSVGNLNFSNNDLQDAYQIQNGEIKQLEAELVEAEKSLECSEEWAKSNAHYLQRANKTIQRQFKQIESLKGRNKLWKLCAKKWRSRTLKWLFGRASNEKNLDAVTCQANSAQRAIMGGLQSRADSLAVELVWACELFIVQHRYLKLKGAIVGPSPAVDDVQAILDREKVGE